MFLSGYAWAVRSCHRQVIGTEPARMAVGLSAGALHWQSWWESPCRKQLKLCRP